MREDERRQKKIREEKIIKEEMRREERGGRIGWGIIWEERTI